MFDLFGIRAKREAKRKADEAKKLEKAMAEKKKYQEKKAKIDQYLKEYKEKSAKEAYEKDLENIVTATKVNTECPHCHSKNVVKKICRTKGKIHGESSIKASSSYSSSIFSSYGYNSINSNGNVDGKIDTIPINKCNDCGNEWNFEIPEYEEVYDLYSPTNYIHGYFFRKLEGYFELEYNPYDKKEECNSLEEKREKYIESISKNGIFNEFQNAPRYMLDYALFLGMSEVGWTLEAVLDEFQTEFNYHEDDDKYSYSMPDETWNIVKRMVNWKENN